MLQVLVSIQGLILNTKPYFNEPGFASMSGSVAGEKRSLQYNESTFILSLQTMMYSIKRPPKVNFVTCNPLSLNFTFFYGKIYNCFLLAHFLKKIVTMPLETVFSVQVTFPNIHVTHVT